MTRADPDDLLEPVTATGLLAPGRPVLVLLSGGRDSCALLDLAVRIAGVGSVTALHVNYGLRAADADGDERHCARLCAELGVELAVRRAERIDGDGNLQAWARAVRYDAARELAGAHDVAAAHTATDQLETVLYRLASSPSRRALRGMRRSAGGLVRPLLSVTRAQTTEHCRTRGIGFREDATNADPRYARGRVRHELVPALERVHPAATANVLALAEILADEGELLEGLVADVLGGRREIALAQLRALPPALARLVVQHLADLAVGAPAAGVARRAAEVAALPEHGSAELHLPAGVRARVRAGILSFDRSPTPPARPYTPRA